MVTLHRNLAKFGTHFGEKSNLKLKCRGGEVNFKGFPSIISCGLEPPAVRWNFGGINASASVFKMQKKWNIIDTQILL